MIDVPDDEEEKGDFSEAFETRHNPYQVPALDRGLRILELLVERNRGLRMGEIARELDIPVNSAFRITAALEEHGYLARDLGDRRYRMTKKLFLLGYSALGDGGRLIDQALDIMKKLRDELGETVLFGMYFDCEGVVVEQVAAGHSVKFLAERGAPFPLHASAPGKAILAGLSQAERERLLLRISYTRFNSSTLDSREKLVADLAQVASRGYSMDRAEHMEGVCGVGSAVLDQLGQPVAALWVAGPRFRFSERQFPFSGRAVAKAAEAISHRIGWTSVTRIYAEENTK